MHPALIYGFLGGPVDDLVAAAEQKLEAWATANTQKYAATAADSAYTTFRQRFEADKDVLVAEVVDSAKQPMKDAVLGILNDATTQAKIGENEAQIKSDVSKALVITTVATATLAAGLTWAAIKYL